MTNLDDQADRRGKRGRFEIRSVYVFVLIVLAAALVYGVFFGAPNRENRTRDDPDSRPLNLGRPAPAPPTP